MGGGYDIRPRREEHKWWVGDGRMRSAGEGVIDELSQLDGTTSRVAEQRDAQSINRPSQSPRNSYRALDPSLSSASATQPSRPTLNHTKPHTAARPKTICETPEPGSPSGRIASSSST
jgi:hypothetical protein